MVFLIYQWLEIKTASWLTLVLIVIYGVSAWLLLTIAYYWIPFTEMVVTQVVLYLLIYQQKSIKTDAALSRMTLERSTILHQRIIPTEFAEADNPWSQIMIMIQQTLNIERAIFLNREPGEHFVKEMSSLFCQLEKWDGSLEAYNDIGVGFKFTIAIKGFI